MPTPTIHSAPIIVSGSALARATAMSVAPAANSAQTANTARDFGWFETSVPCRKACPAGTDIPGYLEAIAQGDFAGAYLLNLEANVFPGVLGRVCSRPCESACRHGEAGNGEPVAICFSKRAAADHRSEVDTPVLLPPWFPASGKRIAIVGAGVAGLACARELARFGHRVTVFEKHRAPGGMLIQGIPMFRLPRAVVQREIAQIEALGVEIRCGVSVGADLPLADLAAAHDAVVLAAGTLAPHFPPIEAADSAAEHGLPFLLEVNEFARRQLRKDRPGGSRVLVIGGGYTALDCARTALRLGIAASVVYRRGRNAMVVLAGEIEEFLAEGGSLQTQLAPRALAIGRGEIEGVLFDRTRESSRRDGPVDLIDGSEFLLATDHVLFATGQRADVSWLPPELQAKLAAAGTAAPAMPLSGTHCFVAGDFALGATSLISAIGHAKRCATAVDLFLTGSERRPTRLQVSPARYSKTGAQSAAAPILLTGRDAANNRIPLTPMPLAPAGQRGAETEVELGYAAGPARIEAARCYLCNYKFEIIDQACVLCDECLAVRPVPGCIVEIAALEQDAAGQVTGYRRIERDRTDSLYYNRLWIDPGKCIRCGACEAVCPVNAISVQKVSCESSPR